MDVDVFEGADMGVDVDVGVNVDVDVKVDVDESAYAGDWMLQCVAVCCSVLQCVEVCCSVLQCDVDVDVDEGVDVKEHNYGISL